MPVYDVIVTTNARVDKLPLMLVRHRASSRAKRREAPEEEWLMVVVKTCRHHSSFCNFSSSATSAIFQSSDPLAAVRTPALNEHIIDLEKVMRLIVRIKSVQPKILN
jgi:hypothetical protein